MADWSGADLQAEINGMGGRRGIELVPLEYFSLAVNESVGTGANGPASRPLDSDPWNTHRPSHPSELSALRRLAPVRELGAESKRLDSSRESVSGTKVCTKISFPLLNTSNLESSKILHKDMNSRALDMVHFLPYQSYLPTFHLFFEMGKIALASASKRCTRLSRHSTWR
jgi:hypothetical protein